MRKQALRWVVLFVIVVACGRETPGSAPEPGTVVSFAMDGRGGTVELGTLRLLVPPGALREPTAITVREALDKPWGAVGPVFELGPDGLAFAVAPTLSIACDEVDLPPGVEVQDLRLAVLDHGRWRHVAGSEYDAVDGSAVAKLEHFSTYGLVPLADDTSGVGRHLELNGVVVDTSADVFARLSVAPTIVTLSLGRGGDAPVDVTVSGLPTDSDQYVFLGSYQESRVVRPSDGGRVTVTTTLDEAKFLWVQPGPATILISSDELKDQCAAVGVRVGDTCTLTSDVVGSVEIEGPDQTLDCDGHSIKQDSLKAGSGCGIVAGAPWSPIGTSPPVNTTVRDCVVGGTESDAFGTGLLGWSIEGLRVESSTFVNDRIGIQAGPGTGATIVGNTVTGAQDAGIYIEGPASTNEVRGNHVTMAIGSNAQPTGVRLVGRLFQDDITGSFLPDPEIQGLRAAFPVGNYLHLAWADGATGELFVSVLQNWGELAGERTWFTRSAPMGLFLRGGVTFVKGLTPDGARGTHLAVAAGDEGVLRYAFIYGRY